MNIVQIQYMQSIRVGKYTNLEAASSSLTCGACFFFVFFLKNKVFKYFSTSFPCKVKLSFYPNNYLSFTVIYITVIALRHVRQTKANDHFIDEHEDSFTIVAQTSPVMITTALRKRPVKENDMTLFFSLFCELFSVYYRMK